MQRVLIGMEAGEPLGLGTTVFTSRLEGFVESAEGSGGVGQALLGDGMVSALRVGLPKMDVKVGESQRRTRQPNPSGLTDVELFHEGIWRFIGRHGKAPRAGMYYQPALTTTEMAQIALALGSGWHSAEETAHLHGVAAGDPAALARLRATPPAFDPATRLYMAWQASLPAGEGLAGRFAQQFRVRGASPLTPEFMGAVRLGPGGSGFRSTGMGVGTGALLSPFLDFGITAAHGGDVSGAFGRAPTSMAYGALGWGVSMAAEQALVARVSNGLIQQGVPAGLATGARIIGMRAISGGIGAGVVELVVIYNEDRPHRAGEVVGRAARSTGIGVVSAGVGTLATTGTVSLIGAILASGGSGAATGTVVPGWGNAIGFVVGLGAGLLTYIVLDEALPRVEP
jgi:hypothetical protein